MRVYKKGGNPSGDKTASQYRDVTMESLSEGDVAKLMSMLSGMPGRQPVDYNMTSSPENPYFRFRNLASENQFSPDIIRGQVYDRDRGGYGGDVTLDQMLRMSKQDPELRSALQKSFMMEGADKKAFQKRFNSDPNFARLFVDLYGKQGGIGKVRAVDRGMAKGGQAIGYTSGVDRTGADECL